MTDQTHTASQTIDVTFPTGEELYNKLMSEIEKDLLTQNIPNLQKKYAGETKEQNAERLERYRKAYEKYDETFAAWMKEFDHLVNQYRKEALKIRESESNKNDAQEMNAIEHAFRVGVFPNKQ